MLWKSEMIVQKGKGSEHTAKFLLYVFTYNFSLMLLHEWIKIFMRAWHLETMINCYLKSCEVSCQIEYMSHVIFVIPPAVVSRYLSIIIGYVV